MSLNINHVPDNPQNKSLILIDRKDYNKGLENMSRFMISEDVPMF